MIRNSLKYVAGKDMKAVSGELKTIYKALTVDAAERVFAEKWTMPIRNWKPATLSNIKA